jgi:purine nucleoside permease
MYLPVDLIDQIDDEAASVGMSRSMTVSFLLDSSLSHKIDDRSHKIDDRSHKIDD